MLPKTLVAVLLLALLAILTACRGEEEPLTPMPWPQAPIGQLLQDLPTDAILALTFPRAALAPLPPSGPLVLYLLEQEPPWRIEVLGRLVGHFSRRDQPQLATFLYLRGPPAQGGEPSPQSASLGLPEGLFMALIDVDGQNRPALVGFTLLDSSATEFLEAAAALKQERRPFRQGLDNLAPEGTIGPALAVDGDNDGLEELVLLDIGFSEGIAAAFYLTFQRTGAGLHWQRIAPPSDGVTADMPTQAVLDYLAAVEAAARTAEPWQGLQRFLVWEWLTGDEAFIPDELAGKLAANDSPAALIAVWRNLQATRQLFAQAYDLLSPNRQRHHPWPDFINGFRNATSVRAVEMLPPSHEQGKTFVQVVVIASSREGPDLVDRRFRVTYELIKMEEGWRLDNVSEAKEEEPPSEQTSPTSSVRRPSTLPA